MPLFYASPEEGVAYLESAAADAAWLRVVHAAAVKRGKDEAREEDDDST